jgi:16S rRNA (cytosine1402-N4)-methyltransferase
MSNNLVMTYHRPVMLQECIEALKIDPKGVYVDLTFGGGGHSAAILDELSAEGKLFAFDQDPDALENTIDDPRFKLIASNFRHFPKYLKLHGVKLVDGILADLGVSSHQIDEASRGFSTRFEGDLDMRMDQKGEKTAASVINTYAENDLIRIFSAYGEIKNSRTLARHIVDERNIEPIRTTSQLNELIRPLARRGKENQYLAQVYQALRIEVNDEMAALEEMLVATESTLKPGGRLVVMSYHSLEDRPVKFYINTGNLQGKQEKDFYGNLLRPLTPVNRKPILASEAELASNNRARSAKLRIAEK